MTLEGRVNRIRPCPWKREACSSRNRCSTTFSPYYLPFSASVASAQRMDSRKPASTHFMLFLLLSSIFVAASSSIADRQIAVILSRIDQRYLNEKMTPEQWREVLEKALLARGNDDGVPGEGVALVEEPVPVVVNGQMAEVVQEGPGHAKNVRRYISLSDFLKRSLFLKRAMMMMDRQPLRFG